MEKKLITVIIPTYNRKKKLLECISSILEQTYEHIEVLVVMMLLRTEQKNFFREKQIPVSDTYVMKPTEEPVTPETAELPWQKGNCWPFRTVTICGILRSWRNSMHGCFPTKPICVSAG